LRWWSKKEPEGVVGLVSNHTADSQLAEPGNERPDQPRINAKAVSYCSAASITARKAASLV
jgi:hypothetical protein